LRESRAGMKRRSGEIVSPSREASRYTDVFEYIKKREAEIVPRGWREGEGEEGSRQRPERERERERRNATRATTVGSDVPRTTKR